MLSCPLHDCLSRLVVALRLRGMWRRRRRERNVEEEEAVHQWQLTRFLSAAVVDFSVAALLNLPLRIFFSSSS